jgi:nucleoside-diphosphate-sugar epimerase
VNLTILITGGTGLVGQDLVYYLVNETFYGKKPYKIRLLIRNKKNNPNRRNFLDWCEDKGIDVFIGDLRNDDDVLNFSNVSDPDNSTIIHCGAIFNFWQPFDLIYDVNVIGTRRILNAFHKNNLKKLIYLSSAAVYGEITGANGRGVTEDQPIDLNQRKSYELSKAEGENLVREYLNQNPDRLITILRPTGIVGGSGTTTDLFARMFFGRFVPLPRGGKDKLSLVDVKDVTASIVFFMDSVRGNGEAYNVVSFTASLREVIQELGDAIGKKKAKIISIPLFVFKPIYYLALMIRFFKKPNEKSLFLPVLFDKLGKDVWIDHSKLISTGFQPKVTLTESMIKIEQFITNNVWYAKEKFGFAV